MNETPEAEAQSFTARIGMWSARHRKAVAIAWVLIVIAALADALKLTGTPSFVIGDELLRGGRDRANGGASRAGQTRAGPRDYDDRRVIPRC